MQQQQEIRHVVVTGGAGFIGSHLVEALRRRGRRVTILDDLSTGRVENVRHCLDDQCQLLEGRVGDLCQRADQIFDGVQQVYHLAATVGVQRVVEQPVASIRNNVEETATLLEAVSGRDISVLLTSSSEVYGKNTRVPMSEEDDLVVGPTTSPRWSYALAKALDEHLMLAGHRLGQFSGVIVRLFNTIGPRQVGSYGMVVPRFIAAAMKNEALTIYGNGEQTRAFCDVRDVVEALIALSDAKSAHGQAYNVGQDKEMTINQLAERIKQVLNSRSSLRHVPYAQVYGQGFEDPARRVPAMEKLRQAIAFQPHYDLDQTIRDIADGLDIEQSEVT